MNTVYHGKVATHVKIAHVYAVTVACKESILIDLLIAFAQPLLYWW